MYSIPAGAVFKYQEKIDYINGLMERGILTSNRKDIEKWSQSLQRGNLKKEYRDDIDDLYKIGEDAFKKSGTNNVW